MSKLDIFVNDKFKVMSYMYDMMDKSYLVRVTQTELVEELGLSRSTINAIFRALKENGYIVHDDKKLGKYYLTEDAVKVVKMFRKIN